MRSVSIVGTGQAPVRRRSTGSLRELGAEVGLQAMAEAGVDNVDSVYVSNMLADELQCQKHLGALIADEAGLAGVEALEVRAATAAGAAALHMGILAVASGAADLVLVIGVEVMSGGVATPILAKALDAEREVRDGATLISQNAQLMQLYFNKYGPPKDSLAHFSVNAHRNAMSNPMALFSDQPYSVEDVMSSRPIAPPIRLLDCSPICDGAAAVLLAPSEMAHDFSDRPVFVAASSVATDRFRVHNRQSPLDLRAARLSAGKAYSQSGLAPADIDFFELHDAFSIMACLSLEASGMAGDGEGWKLAVEGDIALGGRVPVATMGGLKARGHPIGATALYQTAEAVLQLTGRAGANQLPDPGVGMMQSVGGAAATVITHIFKS